MSILQRISKLFAPRTHCSDCGAPLVKIYYTVDDGFSKNGIKKTHVESFVGCSKYRNYNDNFDGTRRGPGWGLQFIGDPGSHTGWSSWTAHIVVDKVESIIKE